MNDLNDDDNAESEDEPWTKSKMEIGKKVGQIWEYDIVVF